MNFSLATFFADTAKDNPNLYAFLVVITMTVAAVVTHRVLGTLHKIFRL